MWFSFHCETQEGNEGSCKINDVCIIDMSPLLTQPHLGGGGWGGGGGCKGPEV